MIVVGDTVEFDTRMYGVRLKGIVDRIDWDERPEPYVWIIPDVIFDSNSVIGRRMSEIRKVVNNT